VARTNPYRQFFGVLLRPGLSDRQREVAWRGRKQLWLSLQLTLPTLFAFLFCFINTCLLLYSYEMISQSEREGTRYAMVRGASCPTSTNPTCEVTASQVNTYVSGKTWPTCRRDHNSKYTYPDGNEAVGSRVKVTVTVMSFTSRCRLAEQFLHPSRARRRRRLSSRWESCG